MKIRLITAALLTLLICCCSFTAFAETTPMEDIVTTEDVFATEIPDNTEIPDETENYTDPYATTVPDYTEETNTTPTGESEPSTGETVGETEAATTEVYTNPTEPTEPDENSTYSDYVSPAPVYTPADQDFDESDWQEIKLDLKADPVAGKQDFSGIQNNNSKGNDSIAGFLIFGLASIFISIAGFTFVFLYKPNKKKKAHAGSSIDINELASSQKKPKKGGTRYAQPNRRQNNTRTQSTNRRTYNPDDYNDGF